MSKIASLLVLLLFICLFVAEFFHPIYAINQDLGRHLTLGKIIVQTLHVPTANLFSYTYPNFLFINTHWLSEVIFYFIVQSIGFSGLLIATTTIVGMTMAILFLQASKKSSLLSIATVLLLSAGILFERTDIRPEIFSYFFLTIFILILFRNHEKTTKLLFLLPFIELLWVNMHIYFILGPIVMAFFLIDRVIIDFFLPTTQKNTPQTWYVFFILSFSLTLIALLINPSFLKGAIYPFSVFQNYGYTIFENQTIFFIQSITQDRSVVFFEIACITLLLLLLLHFRKSRPVEWFLALFFIYIGINQIRNMPLFIFATFGFFTYYLDATGKDLGKISLIRDRKQLVKIVGIGMLFIVGIYEITTFVSRESFGFALTPQAQNAVAFFRENQLRGPIFNNFDIGSYLIYTLYPKQKVFVDGRPEAYPAIFFQNTYIPMQESLQKFNDVDKKYHFNTIIFAYSDATPWAHTFIQQIVKSQSWKLVYLDGTMVIFVKNALANQTVIQKYLMTEKNFSLSAIPHRKDPNYLLLFANFLNEIGWQQAETQVLQEALLQDATYCPAIYQLAVIYTQGNESSLAAIYQTKYEQLCR